MDQLVLKRASASRPSGQWDDHDYRRFRQMETVREKNFASGAWPMGLSRDADAKPVEPLETY
jgi:hypothetical protein